MASDVKCGEEALADGASVEPNADDVRCTICFDVMVEPVTLPCNHEFCLACFKEHMDKTSLECPICRKRVSNWVRDATRHQQLVNQTRWQYIQTHFADELESQRSGEPARPERRGSRGDEPAVQLAAPGEIHAWYEQERQKGDEERRADAAKEEAASAALIEKLRQAEQRRVVRLERRDVEMARRVAVSALAVRLHRRFSPLQQLDDSIEIEATMDRMRLETADSASAADDSDADASSSSCQMVSYEPEEKPKKDTFLYAKADIDRSRRMAAEGGVDADEGAAGCSNWDREVLIRTPTPPAAGAEPAVDAVVDSRPPSQALDAAAEDGPGHAASLEVERRSLKAAGESREPSCSPTPLGDAPICSGALPMDESESLVPPLPTFSDSLADEPVGKFRPIVVAPVTPPRKLPDGRPVDCLPRRVIPERAGVRRPAVLRRVQIALPPAPGLVSRKRVAQNQKTKVAVKPKRVFGTKVYRMKMMPSAKPSSMSSAELGKMWPQVPVPQTSTLKQPVEAATTVTSDCCIEVGPPEHMEGACMSPVLFDSPLGSPHEDTPPIPDDAEAPTGDLTAALPDSKPERSPRNPFYSKRVTAASTRPRRSSPLVVAPDKLVGKCGRRAPRRRTTTSAFVAQPAAAAAESKGEPMEMGDEELAKKLQWEFDLERRHGVRIDRLKGNSNAYPRRSRRGENRRNTTI